MGTQIEYFDVWRQRMAFTALADSPDFLNTAEGAALIEQIRHRSANMIVWEAREMDFALEPDDVVNGAILLLTEQDGRISRYIASADGEPWGYFYTCLKGWARQQWGHRGSSLEVLEDVVPAGGKPDDDLTPLEEVVRLTFEALSPHTPERLHSELLELLRWLAANPPQRLSYETGDKVAAHRFAPAFSIMQVTAVMNIAWGGRPRQADTSLFGQYLLDDFFRPSESPTHARALTYFKKQMRAGEGGSRMLTDWPAR